MVRNIKIPKRVGAVKLPKKVRRKAKKAIEAAASPLVRDFASAAMAAANRIRREAGDGHARKEEVMCKDIRIQIDGNKLGEAIRKAAADGLKTFLEGLEEGLREARKTMDDPQPDPQAKAAPEPPEPPKPPKAAKPPKPPKPPKPARPRKPATGPKAAPRAPGA
jgi:hypothetical protein